MIACSAALSSARATVGNAIARAAAAKGLRSRETGRAFARVDRPPYEQLMREIEATSYVAVGRRYGVSDNAIRKWVLAYRREAAAGDDDALASAA